MPTTMTTLDAVLKFDYIGPIRENLNQKRILMNKIRKSSEEVVGKKVHLPLHSGRNSGVGARPEGGTLPTAGNQQYKEAEFPTKTVYGRIQITGKTIRATRNDRGAFLRAISSETKGMVDDVGDDINRQLFVGSTGTLCNVTVAANSTTQTVDNTQYLFAGMVVSVGATGDRTVSVVNSETSVTFTAIINTVGNEVCVRQGVTSGDELTGLDEVVRNSGTLYGIDPTTSAGSFFKANVRGTSGTTVQLNEIDMEKCVDDAEEKGGDIDYIITSYNGRREYYKILQSQKRFADMQSVTLRGGYKAILFNDIPMVVDRHCQRTSSETRMYFLDSSSFGHYRMADFDWMQEDGSILARIVGSSGQEAYEGTLVYDAELGCDARNKNSVLLGIKVN